MEIQKFRSENGFTLIESLVAMLILGIGIMALYSMQLTSVAGNTRSNLMTISSNWNADQLEKLIGVAYDDTDLDDTDNDGTNQDANEDGLDDDGGDFGLDDVTDATADSNMVSFDNRYKIYSNVATDHPIPNVKTIRIHVVRDDARLAPPVVFTYIKADVI